jgi:S-DNA-T family DNA segregation ATPase FtsK/SpoIIIE
MLIFSSFTIIGCIIFTAASSFYKFKITYLAGGVLGYVLTKLIFVEVVKNYGANILLLIMLSIVWIFICKKALFISARYFIIPVIIVVCIVLQEFISKLAKSIGVDIFFPLLLFFATIISIAWILFHEKQPVVKLRLFINKKIQFFKKKEVNNAEIQQLQEFGIIEEEEGNAHAELEPADQNKVNIKPAMSGAYSLPPLELLDKHKQSVGAGLISDEKIAALSAELTNVLEEFGIKGDIINVRQGPVVTMFEFRPAAGIKTSRIISLSDDIARSMSAISARISIIPGQNAIGIELPNKNRQTVYLLELLSSDSFKNFTTGIPLILGKDINGNPVMADLAKMPHLLVAGTTGSGKSVSINDMILSILFKFTPDECKLIMVDPKMLELSVYDEIPHLLTPVVTEPKKAVFALKWAVSEMENRYRQMSKLGVRNIDGFNKRIEESKEKGDLLVRKIQTGFDQETGRPIFETQQLDFEKLPYIVVIVDEMADLMLVAGKDIEAAVQRLAQMARAAGIHLIMATQRPSVDVITGTIKANFPTRISFQVTSKIDSRTILGEQGAEQLLGQGDMLYMAGGGRVTRVHGPFVRDNEVERVVEYIKTQKDPSYVDIVSDMLSEDCDSAGSGFQSGADNMYQRALEVVQNDRKVSISYIQRKLQIGYNRAARIIEEMEEKGVVSPPNHSGKREILL